MLGIHADITRQEDVDRLFAQTLDRFGRLDVLVNNAGRSMRGKVLDTTPEQFRELMELNLIALVRCTRAAVPHLLRQRGHVVNIGSLAAKSAPAGSGPIRPRSSPWRPTRSSCGWNWARKGCTCCWSAPARSSARTPGCIRWKGWRTCPSGPGGRGPACRPGRFRRKSWPRRSCGRASAASRNWSCPARARLLFALAQLWPSLGDWIVRREDVSSGEWGVRRGSCSPPPSPSAFLLPPRRPPPCGQPGNLPR